VRRKPLESVAALVETAQNLSGVLLGGVIVKGG
jgi:hypothetical protein